MAAIDKLGLIEFKQEARKGLKFTGGDHARRLDDIEVKIDYLARWLSEMDDIISTHRVPGVIKKGGGEKG